MTAHCEQSSSEGEHSKWDAVNGVSVHLATTAHLSQKAPETWDYAEVAAWLSAQHFDCYAHLIAFEHKIDGATLLTLKEKDLREKPLEIRCLGDIKRLYSCICLLAGSSARDPDENKISSMVSSPSTSRLSSSAAPCGAIDGRNGDAIVCVDYKDGIVPIGCADHRILAKTSATAATVLGEIAAASEDGNGELKKIHLLTREDIIRQVESPDTKGKSLVKLAIAFCYCTFSLLITAFVMVLVHDRVPDMKTYPPLPDIVLDNLPLIPWAFEMCELIAVCLCTIWFTVLFFHKHRVVIMRRMFSLVGTVFLLRCVTMLITSMSVPGVHLECRAKSYESVSAKLWQAYHIWSRLGMSIHGVRSCGDYMFSGHTTAITLLNHLITEYTPETWHGLHTITWVLNLFGIFFILAGHEHYSIDVFIAFYISSRMFLYYHAYAYNHYNLTAQDDRMRLWFPLGWFFEAGGNGRVENEFEFPLYFPNFSLSPLQKYFRLLGKALFAKKDSSRLQHVPKLAYDGLETTLPDNGNRLPARKRKNARR